jgi:hypothetical protein
MSDTRIAECVGCHQTFITCDPHQQTCDGGCALVPTWECDGCHMMFTRDVEPHTQHEPECGTTPFDPVDEQECFDAGCTWADVCQDCCNVCRDVSDETPDPTNPTNES